jgi:hypothetical protein
MVRLGFHLLHLILQTGTVTHRIFCIFVQNFKASCDKWAAMAEKWSLLNSSSIIRLLGVMIKNPVCLVMEDIPLGQLDVYLRENHSTIKVIDLVEACANLASALWHLVS